MIKNKFYIGLILVISFSYCNQNSKDCTIIKWKVIDVYRNNYPSISDTVCNDNFVLFNKQEIDKRFLDSVFNNTQDNKIFTLDTLGTYEIIANTSLENGGLKYSVAKIRYLTKGYNIDQEVLLWVVKDKGIYIQQENDNKNHYCPTKIVQNS